MANGITKETFESADVNSKLNILFDLQHETIISIKTLVAQDKDISANCGTQWKTCDSRFKTIENNWYLATGGILLLAVLVPSLIQYIMG